MNSRLTSTCRITDRYGNRTSVVGVGRTSTNVGVVSGRWYPRTEEAPTFPVWSNGLKLVQAAIWRDLATEDSEIPAVTLTGSHTQTAVATSPVKLDLYPTYNGKQISRIRITIGSTNTLPVCFGSPLRDSLYWLNDPQPDAVLWIPESVTSQVVNGIFPPPGSYPSIEDITISPLSADNSCRVSSVRRYFRVMCYAGNSFSYNIDFAGATILADETNDAKATITDGGYVFLGASGFFELRGGEVATMGFTHSQMPTITSGTALFAASMGQSQANPAIDYRFILK